MIEDLRRIDESLLCAPAYFRRRDSRRFTLATARDE